MAHENVARALPDDYDDPNTFHLNAREGDFHPECGDDETFWRYLNANGGSLPCGKDGRQLSSTRRGVKVIDDFGRDRTEAAKGDFFPVFVNTEELTASRQ